MAEDGSRFCERVCEMEGKGRGVGERKGRNRYIVDLRLLGGLEQYGSHL